MILYIVSVSMQIVGGIILLLFRGKMRDRFIRAYFPGGSVAHPDENMICNLDAQRAKSTLFRLYLNTIAIADIVAGYIIAIWSENTGSKAIVLLGVVGVSVVLILMEMCIANCIAKMEYPKYMKLHAGELDEYGVERTATKKEVLEYLGIEKKQ